MIDPSSFFESITNKGISFFTGVPDSLLKNFCYFISDNVSSENHIICANEGNAVALACGHYIATGNPAFVYMQNSGFGNSINPITSLADKEVYAIPMILLVGWRGDPGIPDEPQHIKKGRISEELINVLELPNYILGPQSDYKKIISESYERAVKEKCPVVILVKKATFKEYTSNFSDKNLIQSELSREDAIEIIVKESYEEDIFVSTTGVASRELFEIRERLHTGHKNDFLTVGGMGHASSIALGIALSNKKQRVLCLDGDGSALMHMGSIAIIGSQNRKNLIYILLNNSSHDSVGGQPTIGAKINFLDIAKGCGFTHIQAVSSQESLKKALNEIKYLDRHSIFLEIKIKKGFRKDLGRPTQTPIENIESLMKMAHRKKIS